MEPIPGAPYRVQIATSATAAVRHLTDEAWAPLRRQLSVIATLAAVQPPPTKALLEEGGLSPPLFRLRAGEWLVLYDVSPFERTLTVLHVVKITMEQAKAMPVA